MRLHRLLLALVAVLLLLPVTTASAQTSTDATQTAEVNVLQSGVLAIGTDEYVGFGDVLAGQQSGQAEFGIWYQNTLGTGADWSATVTATNFYRYEWNESTQQDDPVLTDTFPYTNLTIFPGYDSGWESQGVTFGGQATFAGTAEPSDPVTMMTAPGTLQGMVSPGEQNPWLQVVVPTTLPDGTTDLPQGSYRATLVYTLTG